MNRTQFIFAGNATFTLTSLKTGTSFTYRIARAGSNRDNGPLFASVLTGPDNTRDYTYMGIVLQDEKRIRNTRGSKVFGDAPSWRALEWFLQHVDSDAVEFRHEGRCGRCGRALTVPSSIDSGLGPECAGRV